MVEQLTQDYLAAANALDPDFVPPDDTPEFVRRYKYDPTGFARDCIDWDEVRKIDKNAGITEYQEEMDTLLLRHKRLSVRGPHGLGKTTKAALLIIWFSYTREAERTDWKSLQTASVWRQMTDYLWPEVKKWLRYVKWGYINSLMPVDRQISPPREKRELLDTELKLTYGKAFAVVSTDHQKVEGAHAVSILFIYDESKAIPPKTWDALEGAFSNAGEDTDYEVLVFSISTPGAPSGRFFDIQMRKRGYEDWYVYHVTLEMAIASGRMSREWADQRKKQWGENSELYKNRVLGEFHVDGSVGVIPLQWLEESNERWIALYESGQLTAASLSRVAVDVSGSGPDDTVIGRRHGKVVLSLETVDPMHKINTMHVTGVVAGILTSVGGRAEGVVDVLGYGAGVYDRLKEQGFKVWGFTGSRKSELTDLTGELGFTNKRSESWWGLRELLDPVNGYDICVPPDDDLAGDLTAPTWRVTSGAKIQVQPKEEVREVLGRSPDKGDVVVMLFATKDEEEYEALVGYDDRVRISPF